MKSYERERFVVWVRGELCGWILAVITCVVFGGMAVALVLGADRYIESLPSVSIGAQQFSTTTSWEGK